MCAFEGAGLCGWENVDGTSGGWSNAIVGAGHVGMPAYDHTYGPSETIGTTTT